MPRWRQELTKSLHQSRSMPESRYFQLASVGQSGEPFCRTVVYRGLTDDNHLIVISDTRSEKFTQLTHNANAQVCWYFSKTREQYRFSTRADIKTQEHDEALVQSHWEKLSDAGKKQFLWGDPGSVRNDDRALTVSGDLKTVPTHFCVIMLCIYEVDYLNLRGNPQYRERHHIDTSGNWTSQSLIP